MRQAGIIAAGGLFAMKNNVDRLNQDHARAQRIGDVFQKQAWISEVFPVETNIVVISLKIEAQKEIAIQKFKEQGILVSSFGDGMIRLVVHLDITDEDITQTCNAIQAIQLN